MWVGYPATMRTTVETYSVLIYQLVGWLLRWENQNSSICYVRLIDQFRDQYEMTYICSFHMRFTAWKTNKLHPL